MARGGHGRIYHGEDARKTGVSDGTHPAPRLTQRGAFMGRRRLRSSSGSLAKFAAMRALLSCESRSVSERMRWPVKQLKLSR